MELSSLSTTPTKIYPRPTPESSMLMRKEKCNLWQKVIRGRLGLVVPKHNRFKVLGSSQKKERSVLEAGSMNEIFDALAQRLVPTVETASNSNLKYIVGVAGSPGAGKSTLASEVARRVNMLWNQRASAMDFLVDCPDVAISLPMDGFHLYRHQLDKMENPEEAHARRGAPWTFDPALLLKCLKKLKTEGSVYVPSFDHGVGDPVENDIFVSLQHKVVIVEGNYLLLEEGIWNEVSSIFDEKWFLEVDIVTAMQRVLKRFTLEMRLPLDTAKWRIEYNDRPNAEIINKSKKNADLVIRSVNL
ncbi:hypothetical protein IFM89_021275 [Coptis chinensis]|uniref:Phosphoribulokinase/uridine kinase domain-containing protein n=1 Tax=Coptis chinensis TaxID=261450 RepID=A0A835LWM7_9MAGN|nr:hypothetical protein IFM89_021275 [Coptis chinensis]